jgi:hypothetical protein
MIGNDTVPLLVHLESKVTHERELRQLQEKNTDLALKLQAAEYERRLETLNNEAGRIKEVLDKSVTRERFDQYVEDERKAGLIREHAVDLHFSRVDKQLALYAGGLVVLSFLLRFVPSAGLHFP